MIRQIDVELCFFPFIQWHPERMVDQHNPFSLNIRQAFIQAAMARCNSL